MLKVKERCREEKNAYKKERKKKRKTIDNLVFFFFTFIDWVVQVAEKVDFFNSIKMMIIVDSLYRCIFSFITTFYDIFDLFFHWFITKTIRIGFDYKLESIKQNWDSIWKYECFERTKKKNETLFEWWTDELLSILWIQVCVTLCCIFFFALVESVLYEPNLIYSYRLCIRFYYIKKLCHTVDSKFVENYLSLRHFISLLPCSLYIIHWNHN